MTNDEIAEARKELEVRRLVLVFAAGMSVGLLLGLFAARQYQGEPDSPPKPNPANTEPPAFRGEVAKEKVWSDLSGTWEFIRTAPPDGMPHPPNWERWEAKFQIERTTGFGYQDKNGQGSLSLVDAPDGGQFLKWDRTIGKPWWFSINRAMRHSLGMIGDDGWGYMAVRTEGGRGPASKKE